MEKINEAFDNGFKSLIEIYGNLYVYSSIIIGLLLIICLFKIIYMLKK